MTKSKLFAIVGGVILALAGLWLGAYIVDVNPPNSIYGFAGAMTGAILMICGVVTAVMGGEE